MPGARSSTKPCPAQGFSITAATTATRAGGRDLAAALGADLLDDGDDLAELHDRTLSRVFGGDGGVGGAVPDAGMRARAGRRGGDDRRSRPARGRVGDPGGDGLVVAAGGRLGLVPQRHDQRLAGVGAGVGEADDRLAVEELAHQVAEVRRVDERPAVLDLAGAADDRGLAERLDGVHPAECGDQPVGEQPWPAPGRSAPLVGQVVRRTRCPPTGCASRRRRWPDAPGGPAAHRPRSPRPRGRRPACAARCGPQSRSVACHRTVVASGEEVKTHLHLRLISDQVRPSAIMIRIRSKQATLEHAERTVTDRRADPSR